MVEIKILMYERFSPWHHLTSADAIITDCNSKESIQLLENYHPVSESYKNCCMGVVTLYSNKEFNIFMKAYDEKFKDPRCRTIYKELTCFSNCADRVDFVLSHFFSEANCENSFYKAYQMLCCLCCIGTLGLKCFPAPPSCITTPNDVFKKAQLLSCRYGKMEANDEYKIVPPESKQLLKK